MKQSDSIDDRIVTVCCFKERTLFDSYFRRNNDLVDGLVKEAGTVRINT